MPFMDDADYFVEELTFADGHKVKVRDLTDEEKVEWNRLGEELTRLDRELMQLTRPGNQAIALDAIGDDAMAKIEELSDSRIMKARGINNYLVSCGVVAWDYDRPCDTTNKLLLDPMTKTVIADRVTKHTGLNYTSADFLALQSKVFSGVTPRSGT